LVSPWLWPWLFVARLRGLGWEVPDGHTNSGHPSLLLLEEEAKILEPLRNWLATTLSDLRLIGTYDQQSGPALNHSESPDIVVMDISHLGSSVFDQVRTMKSAQPAAAIFALVAVDHPSHRRAVARAGAEACVCLWKLRKELLLHLERHLITLERKTDWGSRR